MSDGQTPPGVSSVMGWRQLRHLRLRLLLRQPASDLLPRAPAALHERGGDHAAFASRLRRHSRASTNVRRRAAKSGRSPWQVHRARPEGILKPLQCIILASRRIVLRQEQRKAPAGYAAPPAEGRAAREIRRRRRADREGAAGGGEAHQLRRALARVARRDVRARRRRRRAAYGGGGGGAGRGGGAVARARLLLAGVEGFPLPHERLAVRRALDPEGGGEGVGPAQVLPRVGNGEAELVAVSRVRREQLHLMKIQQLRLGGPGRQARPLRRGAVAHLEPRALRHVVRVCGAVACGARRGEQILRLHTDGLRERGHLRRGGSRRRTPDHGGALVERLVCFR
mmetsp:Transcript_31712/g.79020  ORF Transcript_31712/g.79020 Transcript_31712/m.79020 type:complete len:340 (+) Transcript_31712:405-1424(+)